MATLILGKEMELLMAKGNKIVKEIQVLEDQLYWKKRELEDFNRTNNPPLNLTTNKKE